jgi:hypothetical protein
MDEAKAALMLRFLVGGRTTRAATRAKSEGHRYVDWSLKLERGSLTISEKRSKRKLLLIRVHCHVGLRGAKLVNA